VVDVAAAEVFSRDGESAMTRNSGFARPFQFCVLVGMVGLPYRALAYSDPERFGAITEEGGGGGRYFTGSLGDGYTCAVCHSGGVAPQVVVHGLPSTGYAPDQLIEAEIAFPVGPANHALALEVVNSAGKDVGLELVPEAEIAANERCGGAPDGRRASYLVQVGDRRVIGVEACEARAVRFRFRTGQLDHIQIVGTVLASDNSATVKGDGVTEIEKTFYRNGASAQPASGGCTMLAKESATTPVWLWLVLSVSGLRARRSKRAVPRASKTSKRAGPRASKTQRA
jgi:hypothetical protein